MDMNEEIIVPPFVSGVAPTSGRSSKPGMGMDGMASNSPRNSSAFPSTPPKSDYNQQQQQQQQSDAMPFPGSSSAVPQGDNRKSSPYGQRQQTQQAPGILFMPIYFLSYS